MSDTFKTLAAVRRPRLLVRAARFGLTDYRRERDLTRLTKSPKTLSPLQALDRLMHQEKQMEATRVAGDASYSFSRHVDVLIALMAEARLLPQPRQSGA